ncbi:MAG: hypothetical protein K2M50_05235 [Treponemataceae bacterium]|nr:hypothetical protein [Treponemataceae bacterium]
MTQWDTRRKIAEKITEKKSDCLFSLRGNHEKIHVTVKNLFNHELDEKYCQLYRIQSFSYGVEKDHGRIEKRECHICTNPKWLGGRGK